MRKLILASQSPRRKQLLETLGFPFDVHASNIEEVIKKDASCSEVVMDLAYQKAKYVYDQHPDCVVLGSDTIVVVDNRILGKPHNKQQAREMMEMLKNREHEVITGVAILSNKEEHVFFDCSKVYFEDISEQDIEDYINTPEAYDKAGGYAIQGWAGKYISKIEGNYYTIMGLPLNRVFDYLRGILNE